VRVLGREPFGGPLRIQVGEGDAQQEHLLGPELAADIVVSTELPDAALASSSPEA
jgi:hypothetical protein